MSKAFVRPDDAPVDEVPDRPVPPGRNLVTPEGFERIESEIARLKAAIERAGEGARDYLRRDLRYWMARRASAEIVAPSLDVSVVRFGSTVTVEEDSGELRRWHIVGEDEADPHHGTVSFAAPLARALIGKEVGDSVEVGGHHLAVIEIV
jgi:transcription elongation GreA/GreB family factor